MKFKSIVQTQFEKAGWFENRNIALNQKINNVNSLPLHLKEFLQSYGDLIIEDCKSYKSEVTNTLNTNIDFLKNIENSDLPFPGTYYKIGYFYPDHYMVYTDLKGAIYLIGDGFYKMNDNFLNGIENLIEDNWDTCLEWDSGARKWVK
ncbi:hypothetical protein [Chryseobacterium gwangjuense]|uniref:hypothetical protein n=1 Tax=Chryseobacterium gwangjuense TaxID=1069980 RepID=UPI001E3EC197|nr:hypothetical protein [Chryseobacterium gwangjuense]MCE3075329.1 hypothetical protein [Chryseobacterium gwangjuense]